jgi:hypothetical protein
MRKRREKKVRERKTQKRRDVLKGETRVALERVRLSRCLFSIARLEVFKANREKTRTRIAGMDNFTKSSESEVFTRGFARFGRTNQKARPASCSACVPLIPRLSKNLSGENGSLDVARVRDSSKFPVTVRAFPRPSGHVAIGERAAVRARATLSAPQERRRIHASRFHLPQASS